MADRLVDDRTVADVVLEVAGFDAWYRFNNGGAIRLFPSEREKVATALGMDPGLIRAARAEIGPAPSVGSVVAETVAGTVDDLTKAASQTPDILRSLAVIGGLYLLWKVTR